MAAGTRRSTVVDNFPQNSDSGRELFEACRGGDLAKVKTLVNSLNVNSRDTAGRKSTPLHFAAGELFYLFIFKIESELYNILFMYIYIYYLYLLNTVVVCDTFWALNTPCPSTLVMISWACNRLMSCV